MDRGDVVGAGIATMAGVVETHIGEGGYATVARRGSVAVKRIKWLHLESAVRELIFIKSCSHQCIISILSIEAEPDSIAIVMKYYPSVLSTYPIRGITDVVSIGYGLLSACKYIHRLGIIHCDIKCDNILVEHGPAPKPILCDFGISMRTEEKMHFGSVQTVTYRAPEVNFSLAAAHYTDKIDVWSVGAVILFLVSGRPMYTYIRGCEDSSVYASRFFGTIGSNRKARLRALYSVRATDILALVLRKSGAGLESYLYKSGVAEAISLMLHPNPQYRSSATTLYDIFTGIVARSFPEIRRGLKQYGPRIQQPAIRIRDEMHSLDELECVINVPIEVIGSCSEDCLNYAEMLYSTYLVATGVRKLEISLACIYIASATYCDSNALRAILSVMDMEQIRRYVVNILRVI